MDHWQTKLELQLFWVSQVGLYIFSDGQDGQGQPAQRVAQDFGAHEFLGGRQMLLDSLLHVGVSEGDSMREPNDLACLLECVVEGQGKVSVTPLASCVVLLQELVVADILGFHLFIAEPGYTVRNVFYIFAASCPELSVLQRVDFAHMLRILL